MGQAPGSTEQCEALGSGVSRGSAVSEFLEVKGKDQR